MFPMTMLSLLIRGSGAWVCQLDGQDWYKMLKLLEKAFDAAVFSKEMLASQVIRCLDPSLKIRFGKLHLLPEFVEP